MVGLPSGLPLRATAMMRSARNRSSSTFETTMHGHCRHCNHWHDAAEVTLSKNAQERIIVTCDLCNKKMLSFGRRSTHNSIISQETIPAIGPDSPSRKRDICNNTLAQGQSLLQTTRPSTAEQVSDTKSSRSISRSQFERPPSSSATANVQPVDIDIKPGTVEPAPAISRDQSAPHGIQFQAPQWHSSEASFQSGSIRFRVFQKVSKVTKRLGRLCGLEVHLTVSRLSPDARVRSRLSSVIPPEAHPIAHSQDRRLAVNSLRPSSGQSRRPSATATSQADTLKDPDSGPGQGPSVEAYDSPTAPNDSFNDRSLRDDRIRERRRLKTNEAQKLCRCDSFCSCKERHEAAITYTSTADAPSLTSSRTNSESIQSMSSTRLPASVTNLIRGVGGFDFIRRNSRASTTSSRAGRRSSRSSRPSRLSFVTNSDPSSSRPGSSGPGIRAVLDPTMPPMPFNHRPRELSTITQTSQSTPQERVILSPLNTGMQIMAEPDSFDENDEDDQRLAAPPRTRSRSSHDSITPTQATVNVDEQFTRRNTMPL